MKNYKNNKTNEKILKMFKKLILLFLLINFIFSADISIVYYENYQIINIDNIIAKYQNDITFSKNPVNEGNLINKIDTILNSNTIIIFIIYYNIPKEVYNKVIEKSYSFLFVLTPQDVIYDNPLIYSVPSYDYNVKYVVDYFLLKGYRLFKTINGYISEDTKDLIANYLRIYQCSFDIIEESKVNLVEDSVIIFNDINSNTIINSIPITNFIVDISIFSNHYDKTYYLSSSEPNDDEYSVILYIYYIL